MFDDNSFLYTVIEKDSGDTVEFFKIFKNEDVDPIMRK